MPNGVDHPFAIVPCRMLREVKPTSVVVYAILAEHANADQECWPSVSRIADRGGLAEATVRSAVRELSEAGWLTVRGRVDDDGRQTSNLYKVRRIRNSDVVPQQNTTPTPTKKRNGPPSKNVGRTRPSEQDAVNLRDVKPNHRSVAETRELLDEYDTEVDLDRGVDSVRSIRDQLRA